MKTFNCNIEINKNKIKQPKFSFNDKGLFDSQKYDITDVGSLIFASSINKIFGFTTKSFKEMIIKCNTNNLLKNESAFESIELKKEEEEEKKFTLDFLIESNKTSVLSVFKGKII
ncbi:hypothetical protein V5B83_001845 [Campylobacter jejuni]|nr:hypothetical protein [Campylobacter jejuni]EAH7852902.1 hypothetical protein [Campylobacter coli]EAH4634714.1 hypothetical protein [Campylobacter jejuni]EAH7921826.1 hypothetical protein [Campylobacter coli]EAH7961309.1 hypothetical protein [Campylobacter coli]